MDSNHAGGVHWSSLGDGLFGDTMANSTWYLPGTQDYSNCRSTLLVREWPFGTCLGIADSLNIAKEIPAWSAGLSQQLNYGDTAYLAAKPAATTNYQFGYWTSTGDGHFTDSNDAHSAYILGTQDWADCAVALYWHELDQACGGRTDSLAVVRKSTTIDAGIDLLGTYDTSLSFNLNGWSDTANGYTAYWKTLGDGTFSDTLDLNASYTPGIQDKNNCFVLLSLIEYPQGGCTNFDGIRIDIQDSSLVLLSITVDSSSFDSVYFNFYNPHGRYIYGTNSTGTGTFLRPNPNQLVYVLSASDKQSSLIDLVGQAQAPCNSGFGFAAAVHPQLIKTGVRSILNGVNMYPNPNRGEFSISFGELPASIEQIEVFSSDGKRVEMSWEFKGNSIEIKLLNPVPGAYVLRLLSHSKVYTQSFAVQP